MLVKYSISCYTTSPKLLFKCVFVYVCVYMHLYTDKDDRSSSSEGTHRHKEGQSEQKERWTKAGMVAGVCSSNSSAIWEAEAGGYFEPESLRPAWAT
jgi:hypothetical protein